MIQFKIFTGKNFQKDLDKWFTDTGLTVTEVIKMTQSGSYSTTTISVFYKPN